MKLSSFTSVALALCLSTFSSAQKLSQSQAISRLRQYGITTNAQPPQTSLEGVQSTTIDGAIGLKQACGCQLIITGGTETNAGHAGGTYSHLTGYKLDFRPNSGLDNFIKSRYTKIANRGQYPQWKNPQGDIYCLEGNHWDVVYYGRGGSGGGSPGGGGGYSGYSGGSGGSGYSGYSGNSGGGSYSGYSGGSGGSGYSGGSSGGGSYSGYSGNSNGGGSYGGYSGGGGGYSGYYRKADAAQEQQAAAESAPTTLSTVVATSAATPEASP